MLEVVVTSRAAAQIRRAARWWAENRPAAAGAIANDFKEARNIPGNGQGSATDFTLRNLPQTLAKKEAASLP